MLIKKLTTLVFIYACYPISVYADRYGIDDITDESSAEPIWFIFYILGSLWICTSKSSPLHEWVEANSTVAIIVFVFAVPAVMAFFTAS